MFPKMKQTALSINVGCGETVITGDLVKALESGSIAGAGLDVVDPEPLPAGRSTVAGSQCHHHPSRSRSLSAEDGTRLARHAGESTSLRTG
jgi:phosphoglycerate dehydrogenase-like enzyme